MPPKASIVNAAQPSLDGWLSVSGSAAATTSSTPVESSLRTHSPPLLDKDSIFLSATFPLTAPPTTSQIRSLINLHLSPPRAEGLPKVVERGDGVMPSHRMYAWRCLSLRKDRRVLSGGEEDWEVKEGSEDDGEQYGGDRLLQVMRDLGAVDCIVFCCRWFGGTLLGPIRFAHIQSTAKHALSSHLKVADLLPFLTELQARDARIAQLRSVLPPPAATSGSTPVKLAPAKEPDYSKIDQTTAERLLVARGRAIEGLERKVKELKEARRAEKAEHGRQSLKRAAEAILVEDGSSEEEAERPSRRQTGKGTDLPAFKKRKGKETAVIGLEDPPVQLDEDADHPTESTSAAAVVVDLQEAGSPTVSLSTSAAAESPAAVDPADREDGLTVEDADD